LDRNAGGAVIDDLCAGKGAFQGGPVEHVSVHALEIQALDPATVAMDQGTDVPALVQQRADQVGAYVSAGTGDDDGHLPLLLHNQVSRL
jgi:hypothetical protein